MTAILHLRKVRHWQYACVPLIVCMLACLGCNPAPHTRLPLGNVDRPPLNQVTNAMGKVDFFGWGFADGGLREVNVYLDGNYVASASRGFPRPDVADHFANNPEAREAGWQAVVDVSNVAPGQHQFVIQGVANSGAVREFGVVTVNVVKP